MIDTVLYYSRFRLPNLCLLSLVHHYYGQIYTRQKKKKKRRM